ncbi:hypothetical protein ACLKA7_001431 [Drosophila subpalustris]
MALDALVTVLACLSTTTTTMPEKPVPIIMRNSWEPFIVDNRYFTEHRRLPSRSSARPINTLLPSSFQHMTDQLQTLKLDLKELQELINEYVVELPEAPIESRILRAQPAEFTVMNSGTDVNVTPRNCLDQKHGHLRIRIAPGVEPFYVNCDQKVRNGGWLVIAYRFDGSEDFNRDWHTYKTGFGALNSEFFIGLDKLHLLTNNGDHELLIIMKSKTGEERFALYDQFSIGSEAEKYLLYVLGAYRGDAGDSLRYHAGKKFTTFDQDNDDNGQNCARIHAGAWWYGRECFER